MSTETFFVLIVVGGLLGLDTVSFPQAMLSRPIVAGTLGGAILGEPLSGVLFGATLELFALETLPVGASRYPEWGSASTIGGALFAHQAPGRAGALMASIVVALLFGWLGGWTMVQLRKLNAEWARRQHLAVAEGSRRVVTMLQLAGLAADLGRGIALTALGLAIGLPGQAAVLARFGASDAVSRAVVASTAAAVALGAMWKVFHATPGARWLFLAGLAAGLAVAVSR
jgi:PTS system mannose-specific IIC component